MPPPSTYPAVWCDFNACGWSGSARQLRLRSGPKASCGIGAKVGDKVFLYGGLRRRSRSHGNRGELLDSGGKLVARPFGQEFYNGPRFGRKRNQTFSKELANSRLQASRLGILFAIGLSGRRAQPSAKPPLNSARNTMSPQLRIAKPVRDLPRTTAMYCRGLGLRVVGSFENHDGFDGVMPGRGFELPLRVHPLSHSSCRASSALKTWWFCTYRRQPSGKLPAPGCWTLGFKQVASFQSYWETQGRTFEDPDGYRIVLQQAEWRNVERP